MKHQIVLMRVANGILVDGPSLDKPIVMEKTMNVITFVRENINLLKELPHLQLVNENNIPTS